MLCAETHTLAAASRLGRLRELLDFRDRILVLASDTGLGVAAALYLAQHIAGLELPNVVYQSTPDGLPAGPLPLDLKPGTITILRLRGLDPAHASAGFIDAIAGIGLALRAAFDLGERMEVHLTGGYTATLLHTLVMTELLNSLDPDRVHARYVFEDTGSGSDSLIEIGLRQFDQEYCDAMRGELTVSANTARLVRAIRRSAELSGIRTEA